MPDESALTDGQRRALRACRRIAAEGKTPTKHGVSCRCLCSVSWAADRLAELVAMGYSWEPMDKPPVARKGRRREIEASIKAASSARTEAARKQYGGPPPKVDKNGPKRPEPREACQELLKEWRARR